MNHVDDACRRLGRPALAPVVEELARRLDEGRGTPTRITLRGLHDDHRSALADLLRSRQTPAGRHPHWKSLDFSPHYALSTPNELLQSIRQLHGHAQSHNRPGGRTRGPGDSAYGTGSACQWTVVANVGPLREWPTQVRREGIRGDLDTHRLRLTRVFDVLSTLTQVPQAGMPLATFANLALGDSHALDHGQPLARLVVTAIADAANEPRPSLEDARRSGSSSASTTTRCRLTLARREDARPGFLRGSGWTVRWWPRRVSLHPPLRRGEHRLFAALSG